MGCVQPPLLFSSSQISTVPGVGFARMRLLTSAKATPLILHSLLLEKREAKVSEDVSTVEVGGLRSFKLEATSYHGIASREIHCAQSRRRVTIVGSVRDGGTDCKLHYPVRAAIILVFHDIASIPHYDLLARKTGKVDDYLVTLGHGNVEVRSGDGLR